MEHFIKDLHIKNFKSIKDVKMDCSRINLIVGKPNVGKSNILEALSLFCAPYSRNEDKFLSEFIRYNELEELFFDSEVNNPISVSTGVEEAILLQSKDKFQLIISYKELFKEFLDNNIFDFHRVNEEGRKGRDFAFSFYQLLVNGRIDPQRTGDGRQAGIDVIKKYLFASPSFARVNGSTLLPPFGENSSPLF